MGGLGGNSFTTGRHTFSTYDHYKASSAPKPGPVSILVSSQDTGPPKIPARSQPTNRRAVHAMPVAKYDLGTANRKATLASNDDRGQIPRFR